MAMQSLYDVLKEKEIQLQELQRLLAEAQGVLNRVLELNAVANDSARGSSPATVGIRNERQTEEFSANGWSGNASPEFP